MPSATAGPFLAVPLLVGHIILLLGPLHPRRISLTAQSLHSSPRIKAQGLRESIYSYLTQITGTTQMRSRSMGWISIVKPLCLLLGSYIQRMFHILTHSVKFKTGFVCVEIINLSLYQLYLTAQPNEQSCFYLQCRAQA